MQVELFSFFAGLGFLDLGFEDAGFDIFFVNEHNERFLDCYKYARKNRKHTPKYGYSNLDVREYLSNKTSLMIHINADLYGMKEIKLDLSKQYY